MGKQDDELFDMMIKIAGREIMRREAETFPAENDIEVTFSPEFEKRMKMLIRRNRRNPRTLPKKVLRYAVICAAVITITFISAFAFSPQFRESVVKAIVEWTGISADFSFADDSGSEIISDGIRPAYIPNGFVEIDFWQDGSIIQITYANEELTEIYYWRGGVEGSKLSIDSEHSDYSTRTIQELEAHIFTSNAEGYPSYVVFNNDSHYYLISGCIPVEELILIAESAPRIV